MTDVTAVLDVAVRDSLAFVRGAGVLRAVGGPGVGGGTPGWHEHGIRCPGPGP